MRRLVLASTSRHRRAQLDALGVPYDAIAPTFVEDHARGLSADQMAIEFARGKAESLANAHADALIIGADQTVADAHHEGDGVVLTKPETPERAVAQLMMLQGRTHRLCSAIALHDPERRTTTHRLVVHHMHMRPLTRALAEAYVARDRPLDCVGSYRIEATGALLFREMRGDDHTAIIGLPIAAMTTLLEEVGFDLLAAALSRPSE